MKRGERRVSQRIWGLTTKTLSAIRCDLCGKSLAVRICYGDLENRKTNDTS